MTDDDFVEIVALKLRIDDLESLVKALTKKLAEKVRREG